MKVIAAKNIGFCFGVERAIEIARKEVEDGGERNAIITGSNMDK